jgi:serine/threonine-protein kinase
VANDSLVAGLAGAILDGTPIDWTSAESSADDEARPVVRQLRLLSAVADIHRRSPSPYPRSLSARTTTADRAEQPKTWGHLRVLERIGRGSFGDVFRAWDTRLDREVALKLLPARAPAGRQRAASVIEEGRLLARVRHPNVVTIFGAERIGDRVGLWMELVRGRSLQQILDGGNVFPVADGIDVGVELCRAISAVHGAGLLHRDIKTHNVMLAEDGRLVLMDFGTGRELNDVSAIAPAGTPLYLAPEILRGEDASIRTDIYSVGVLLYHLLTGSYPVQGRGMLELRGAHERGERTTVAAARPDLPPKLARIIDRAIDPRPERRYPTADALKADLAALKQHPKAVRVAHALAAVAALLLAAVIGWEVGGRSVKSAKTPMALLAHAVGLNPVAASNVSPVEQPVIAVLPFENLSAEPDGNYFADGLSDEILRNLAVIRGLEVRSRTSSFAFRDKPRNLREVGEQLGANLVVEGSILRSGNRVRINAQLIQVAGDVPLWAERFDRELKDIFVIQDEISRAIVNKLRLTLGTGQRRYDIDADTWNLYLKARALLVKRGENARTATELFQQVVEKDPSFAPAYAGLADAYGFLSHPTLSSGVAEAALPLMQQEADRALALDGLLAEGHAAKGFIYARQYDWENATQSFRRAIELNPSLTLTYVNYWSTTLLPLEKLDEGERLLQVAMRTDPLSPIVHDQLGFMKLVAGRFDEAVDHFTRAYALDPDLAFLDQHIGRALTFAGRLPEALSFFDTLPGPQGGLWKDYPGAKTWLARAYVSAGRRAEVQQWTQMTGEPYRLAVLHAALGNKDRTFEELNKAAEIVPHRVVPLLAYPEMRLLRGDPRLAALRVKLRLP